MLTLDKVIKDIRSAMCSGRAILFCGAGFSDGAKNINGKQPAFAKELAKQICKLGKFEESEDLMNVSDFYISRPQNVDLSNLIKFLEQEYTIKSVETYHENIVSYPWRRIYTTNYDDAIEMAGRNVGKKFDFIDLKNKPQDVCKKNNNCVHINGHLNALDDKKIRDGYLKLSDLSYYQNTFSQSDWNSVFKSDLDSASVIIFIGYSLYDEDIKKLLLGDVFNGGSYKDKTYFINSKELSDMDRFKFENCGKLISCGVGGFGESLGKCTKEDIDKAKAESTGSLTLYELYKTDGQVDDTNELSDEQRRNFFYEGKMESKYFDIEIYNDFNNDILVKREELDRVVDDIKQHKNIILAGELGCGKSVFLSELKSMLTSKVGMSVYFCEDGSETKSLYNDFEILRKGNQPFVLIVDGYKFKDFIEQVAQINDPKVTLVIATRYGRHEGLFDKILKSHLYDLDRLECDECEDLIQIFDGISAWKEGMFAKTHEQKVKYLQDDCGGEMATILLDIFESPQIKAKIDEKIKPLLENDDSKRTIFAICFIALVGLDCNPSMISDIAGNNRIYDSNFQNDENFKKLFVREKGHFKPKSSVFANFVIKSYFEPQFIKENLWRIASSFFEKKDINYAYKEIFRHTVRFSFIVKLIKKIESSWLRSYYEQIKVKIPSEKRDPHFWLQYGMAELSYPNLENAERYLKTAYELANQSERYEAHHIDNQWARLCFLKLKKESDKKKIWPFFVEGHNKINQRQSPTDEYYLRRVLEYKDVYDSQFHNLDDEHKKKFLAYCQEVFDKLNDRNTDKTTLCERCKDLLLKIINQVNVS